jgi:hypothetical protein
MKNILAHLVIVMGVWFALPAGAQIQYANEFWISTNATGNFYPASGSTNVLPAHAGTLDDPLDGSTAVNFDFNISNLPPYCTIHLLPGTFQTSGNNAWGLIKSGQKYIGSGMDITIVQVVSSAPDGATVLLNFGGDAGYIVTNAEVSDLTADANSPGGSIGHNGVTIMGTRNAIRRVKVINNYGPPGHECWGLACDNYALPYSEGNIIEECEVTNHLGGGITAIDFGGGLGGYPVSGIIRGNRVFLARNIVEAQPATGSLTAINCEWGSDVLIEGNYINGATSGVYSDTGGVTNMIITHNTFKNCYRGVCLDAYHAPELNITAAFNNFFLYATNTFPSIAFNFWPVPRPMSSFSGTRLAFPV